MLEPHHEIDWLGFDISSRGLSIPRATFDGYRLDFNTAQQNLTFEPYLKLLGQLQWAVQIHRYLQPRVTYLQQSIDPRIRTDRQRHGDKVPLKLAMLLNTEIEYILGEMEGLAKASLGQTSWWKPAVRRTTYIVYTDASKKFLGFNCRGFNI